MDDYSRLRDEDALRATTDDVEEAVSTKVADTGVVDTPEGQLESISVEEARISGWPEGWPTGGLSVSTQEDLVRLLHKPPSLPSSNAPSPIPTSDTWAMDRLQTDPAHLLEAQELLGQLIEERMLLGEAREDLIAATGLAGVVGDGDEGSDPLEALQMAFQQAAQQQEEEQQQQQEEQGLALDAYLSYEDSFRDEYVNVEDISRAERSTPRRAGLPRPTPLTATASDAAADDATAGDTEPPRSASGFSTPLPPLFSGGAGPSARHELTTTPAGRPGGRSPLVRLTPAERHLLAHADHAQTNELLLEVHQRMTTVRELQEALAAKLITPSSRGSLGQAEAEAQAQREDEAEGEAEGETDEPEVSGAYSPYVRRSF